MERIGAYIFCTSNPIQEFFWSYIVRSNISEFFVLFHILIQMA